MYTSGGGFDREENGERKKKHARELKLAKGFTRSVIGIQSERRRRERERKIKEAEVIFYTQEHNGF